MKIDLKLVERWRTEWAGDELLKTRPMSIHIAQRAAAHALEEAAKAFEAKADESALSSLDRHYRESARFLLAMKG